MINVLPKRLKELRTSHQLTCNDISQVLGYKTAKGYGDIERGKTKLKAEDLKKLANFYKIPMEKFFK